MKNLAQIQDMLSDDDIKAAKKLVTKWGGDTYHVGAWPFISINWYIKTLEGDGSYVECKCPFCGLYRKLGGSYSPIMSQQ